MAETQPKSGNLKVPGTGGEKESKKETRGKIKNQREEKLEKNHSGLGAALEVHTSELSTEFQRGIILQKKMGRASERETSTVRCEHPMDNHY